MFNCKSCSMKLFYLNEICPNCFGEKVEDKAVEAKILEVIPETSIYAFEGEKLEDVVKFHIVKTLENFKGNKSQAARVLGISIKTLYNKLESYELHINGNKQ